MDGNEVALMRHSMMAQLRARQNSDGYIDLGDKPTFTPGTRVRVLSGRFAGCVGIHRGMSARERELVLFDMLGNEFEVEVFADRLIAA
jgi:transcription antitermination factor NusG